VHLSLGDFCELIKGLDKSNAEKAVAVLWYHDQSTPETSMTAGALTKVMSDHHVGTPNSTQLADAIRRTRLCNEPKGGFALKPGSRAVVRDWFASDLDGVQPRINHAEGYMPEAVWVDTRDYVEKVCRQLNGCFAYAYYDGALVMLRRLLETLIIEAYDHLNRRAEIDDAAGNPLMFGKLVERAKGENNHKGLSIGRNTKNALEEVKKLGDRSAHDRRFNACAADLTKIQVDVRAGVQDLIGVASLKRVVSRGP
jgi:hypothetical protein